MKIADKPIARAPRQTPPTPPTVQAAPQQTAPQQTTDDVEAPKQPAPSVQLPPLPSAATAFVPPAVDAQGAGNKSVWSTRLEQAAAVEHQAGVRALDERLREIESLTKLGVPVTCVFDLDNTVFDTRYRTLWVAQEFDRQNGTHWFDGLSASHMRVEGRETASKLGMPDDVIEAFGKFWDREFWNPPNLAHDVPIDEIVALVHRARAAGASICFLTGRTERFQDKESGEWKGFRADTIRELVRAGIDVNDGELVLKPGLHMQTAPFKEQVLRGFSEQGEVGFFVTEGRRDIQHAIDVLGHDRAHCFRLDCTFEDGGPACAGVPVLPGSW